MSQTRAQLEAWRQQNPGLFRGLQQAISRAEGTWQGGRPNYRKMFGGGEFSGDFSKHPDRVVRTPGYASAAAGAYQFMPGTYAEVARELGLKDFSPESQDLAMLYKARQRLLPAGGLAAITKAGALTPELQGYLAPEWASFPTAEGKSYYGQPVKRSSQISAWFDEGARGAQATAQQPSQPAATTGLGLGLLNKFIELMGVTGGLRQMGPQSSLPAPSLPTYDETEGTAPETELLLSLYKNEQGRESNEERLQQEARLQLQQNLAAAEQARSKLLAQALSSFGTPKAVI